LALGSEPPRGRTRAVRAALIFDLDGTLIDSLPGIAASLNHALASEGHPTHPTSAVRGFIGDGTLMTARRALAPDADEARALAVEAAFKRHYARHWPDGTRLFPGIAELVDSLAAGGHPLAVLSNKPHPFTTEIVAALFPPGRFAEVLGQTPEIPRKPAPDGTRRLLARLDREPARARFIGDSRVDRDTATAAGVPFIGVAWGYHDPEHLGPVLARKVAELPGLMR